MGITGMCVLVPHFHEPNSHPTTPAHIEKKSQTHTHTQITQHSHRRIPRPTSTSAPNPRNQAKPTHRRCTSSLSLSSSSRPWDVTLSRSSSEALAHTSLRHEQSLSTLCRRSRSWGTVWVSTEPAPTKAMGAHGVGGGVGGEKTAGCEGTGEYRRRAAGESRRAGRDGK
jgi:hypothetical protein